MTPMVRRPRTPSQLPRTPTAEPTTQDQSTAPVIAVVGPTATGKSALGIAIAEVLHGEVVNCDSMQLYRGMDIGTAKLTFAERHGITHHLVDVLDVVDEATVAAYQEAARAVIADITARGKVPVVVGGTGLYARAALDRLDIPPTDAAVRGRLEALADQGRAAELVERLHTLDPKAAARIDPANVRRVIRALEVIELTGRPFSASMPTRESLRPTLWLGLRLDRAVLDDRIEGRTRAMFAAGLVDEAARLAEHGLREGRTASRAIGYAQALAVLDGSMTQDAAIADTAQATRRYVRRQESWFNADPRIRWLDAADPSLADAALTLVRDSAQWQP